MALKLEDKKVIVAEVATVAQKAVAAVAAENRGMSVAEFTRLRATARNANVYLRVVRNTLARRALEGTDFEKSLKDSLFGPIILAFSDNEPSAPARLFRDFIKTSEKVTVKGIAIGEQAINASQLDKVASLPTRDEAIATLMSAMQAPITMFVRTLAEPHAKLVRTIAAIRDKMSEAA